VTQSTLGIVFKRTHPDSEVMNISTWRLDNTRLSKTHTDLKHYFICTEYPERESADGGMDCPTDNSANGRV